MHSKPLKEIELCFHYSKKKLSHATTINELIYVIAEIIWRVPVEGNSEYMTDKRGRKYIDRKEYSVHDTDFYSSSTTS
jgi:hypothetical protein